MNRVCYDRQITKWLLKGWHNNHHAYPNVAKAGWRWWEIDVTWWAIESLQRLGLARRVILPPPSVLAKR